MEYLKSYKIFEISSVSDNVIEWSDLIYNIIFKNGIMHFLRNLSKKTKISVEIDNEEYTVDSSTINFDIDILNQYIIRNIKSTNKLKMSDINLSVGVTILPDDVFHLGFFNGYTNDHDSVLINNNLGKVELYFDIYLPETVLDNTTNYNFVKKLLKDYNINTKLNEMISHEMDHIYEFYNRKLQVFPDRLKNSLIFKNINMGISKISDDWLKFLDLCYLALSFEQNARITQLYSSIKDLNINNQDEFWLFVEDTDVWKDLIELKNFNAEKFYKKFKCNISDEDFYDVFSNIYSEEEINNNSKNHLILKYLINNWNNSIDVVNSEFKGNIKLTKLPKNLLNNPLDFLKTFDKNFHNRWNKFYRKVSKLSIDIIK